MHVLAPQVRASTDSRAAAFQRDCSQAQRKIATASKGHRVDPRVREIWRTPRGSDVVGRFHEYMALQVKGDAGDVWMREVEREEKVSLHGGTEFITRSHWCEAEGRSDVGGGRREEGRTGDDTEQKWAELVHSSASWLQICPRRGCMQYGLVGDSKVCWRSVEVDQLERSEIWRVRESGKSSFQHDGCVELAERKIWEARHCAR